MEHSGTSALGYHGGWWPGSLAAVKRLTTTGGSFGPGLGAALVHASSDAAALQGFQKAPHSLGGLLRGASGHYLPIHQLMMCLPSRLESLTQTHTRFMTPWQQASCSCIGQCWI